MLYSSDTPSGNKIEREATFHRFCRLILRLLYPGCCLRFAGSLDYESCAKDLQQAVKTKKIELLFLAL
jgi:hypothetical protein